MSMLGKITIFSLLIAVIAGIPALYAIWSDDGNLICAANWAYAPVVVPDEAGGAIISWYDHRLDGDVYAQKVDAYGNVQWTVDGVDVGVATGTQWYPEIASDEKAGAIICWDDWRNPTLDVYAQRISSAGVAQWTTGGVGICNAGGTQDKYKIAADGAGGAIITWVDERGGTVNDDIYAQRVDSLGNVMWTVDGEPICLAASFQSYPELVADGAGGAIITWHDGRGADSDIYAQRVNANGDTLWPADGDTVCSATGTQDWPVIVSDGAGGAIVAWRDYRTSMGDVYAQRVDGNGAVQWTTDGVAVCADAGHQTMPRMTSDDAGGAIIAWQDRRGGSFYDLYAQRIGPGGTALWQTDGVPVCTAAVDQYYHEITSDGAGGAIITWRDSRSGNDDVYVQRLDANGNALWTADGLAVCAEAGTQNYPMIAPDGSGGAFVTWYDQRDGNADIYAIRILPNGQWQPKPAFTAIEDVPKDQGGKISLQWQSSFLDTLPNTEITHYSLWRELGSGAAGPPDADTRVFDKDLDLPIDLEGPAIRRLPAQTGSTWEWLANVPAHHFESYGYTALSLYDSMGTDPNWQYFMVSAHTANPAEYYDSAVDSGYSVDNLSPAAPQSLVAEQSYSPEGLQLTWDPNLETDLSNYAVYRGTSAGFAPAPGNRVATPTSADWFDGTWSWDGTPYYYKVSAVDVHGNESLFAATGPGDVTGITDRGVPQASYLSQNTPNPFNPSTVIAFGLREAGDVSLVIYDVSGRRVAELVNERRPAGHYRERWDGRNDAGRRVASGVYFYKVVAKDYSQIRKMVLLK